MNTAAVIQKKNIYYVNCLTIFEFDDLQRVASLIAVSSLQM